MKFILNKDILTVKDIEIINSGSINYYEADVECDESWDNLIIEAKIVKKGYEVGTPRAVINNKIFIDVEDDCRYCIGFVGYIINNGIIEYQISSNLQSLTPEKGAGEIKTSVPELPTPTEWEIYIRQIQEMLNNIDCTVPQHVKSITEQDIERWNNVDELENVLQDILTIIQSGELNKNQVADIEQLIVSYFENKTVKEVEG